MMIRSFTIFLSFICFISITVSQHIKKLNGKCEIRGPSHIIPCTRIRSGCRSFQGTITCENGSQPLPESKVVLLEEDYVSSDDYITESKIVNGQFQLNGCFSDGIGHYVQLYLLFNNVCKENQTKRSGFLREVTVVNYIIRDNEYDVKVTIPT